MSDEDASQEQVVRASVGGRPTKNTISRDWRPRLEQVWIKRPDLRKGVKDLHGNALDMNPEYGSTLHNFGRKLTEGLPSDDHFGRLLFSAVGLDGEDIEVEDWLADDETWSLAIGGLRDTRVKDRFDALTAGDELDIKITSRPWITYRRARNRGAEIIVKAGEEMVLSLAYKGDRPVRKVNILMFEYMGENKDVQVLNALSDCAVLYTRSLTLDLLPNDSARGYLDGLNVEASEQATYIMYVFVSEAGFDHRLTSLIAQLDPGNPLIPRSHIDEVISLLEKSRAGLLTGRAEYRIL